jgi:hypothetical protein
MESGFYGTEEETYYINSRGQIWCVQSPDLLARNGEPTLCDALPQGARFLDDNLCRDIEIPDYVGNYTIDLRLSHCDYRR